MSPRRICSLLPSATEVIAQLGLADRLVGVSAECRWPAEVVGKPVISAARVDTAALASAEIDRLVGELTRGGRSLYAVDAELIERLDPDLIVTQDLCAVCAVSSDELASACPIDVETLSLDPRTFAQVADSVLTLARCLGVERQGAQIAERMWRKARTVEEAVAGAPRPRVFLAEWVEPAYVGGHWIPEMIEMAGGTPVLGSAGEPAYPIAWEQVLAAEPDLVVIAPCGFDAEQSAERAAQTGLDLPCRAVAVDADGYYSRPAPRLADGVRQLGHLLHPDRVGDPGLPAVELGGCAAAIGGRVQSAPKEQG
ncbi:MAG TPA: ABC transporter substrate-binding protein [Solirubrobacteraceae bacterium]|nr:ABC transporter substrate-binding protein [Solirubrobacteraceae bacterium]